MCVIPCAASQSASSKRSRVVVEKRRTSCVTLVLTVNRAHATTESLCTSRPAHRRCNVFIMHLHSRCRRHEAFVLEIYPTCSQFDRRPLVGNQLGDKYGCSKGFRSN